jgi:hypothetical protein
VYGETARAPLARFYQVLVTGSSIDHDTIGMGHPSLLPIGTVTMVGVGRGELRSTGERKHVVAATITNQLCSLAETNESGRPVETDLARPRARRRGMRTGCGRRTLTSRWPAILRPSFVIRATLRLSQTHIDFWSVQDPWHLTFGRPDHTLPTMSVADPVADDDHDDDNDHRISHMIISIGCCHINKTSFGDVTVPQE